jgi:alpha-glucosidase (family GH31 glycosyl hydrolase)
MLLINVYHRGQILNTSTGVGYDIRAACTFSADETINFRDLKMQIQAGLELLPSQFNINISAWINTAPTDLGGFLIAYLGLFLSKFGE